MIPTAFLQAWSTKAAWPDLRQVEQDLIICRALCDLFNAPALAGKVAFRGGTAIHKLLFKQPLRYSEDIDLVQAHPEPIGGSVDAIRAALSWLGKCRREQAGHSMHLVFKFTPEIDAQATLKLKVEINTREHATLLGVRRYPFAVENDWYRGTAEIASFEPEELFGTKLRALLQRRRNRDLFDLHHGIEQLPLDPEKVIACFDHYLALEGKPITRAMAEQRMLEKLTRSLTEDVAPMLPASVRWSDVDAIQAFGRVWTELIARIGGDRCKHLRCGHRGIACKTVSGAADAPRSDAAAMTASERSLPSKRSTSEPEPFAVLQVESLAVLQAENERLIALLKADEIEWRLAPEPAASAPQPEMSRLSTDRTAEAKRALGRVLLTGVQQ